MPAGLPDKLRYLRFVYDAMRGYANAARAHNTVGWTQMNPEHWQLVSKVIAERKGIR